MQITFCELRCKEVINVVDGRSLGYIIDLLLDCRTGKIIGFVVPGEKSFFNFFRTSNQIFVPWYNICKIGADVILVELYNGGRSVSSCGTDCAVNQLGVDEQNYKTNTVNPKDYSTFQ